MHLRTEPPQPDTPGTSPPPLDTVESGELSRAFEQLKALRQLPENWDGYDGAAPNPDALEAARRFLRDVSSRRAMPCPVISPTRTGGVLIEWERPPQQLEVEFDPLEPASFVYCHQQTHQTLNGPVTTESVLPLLSRLLMP